MLRFSQIANKQAFDEVFVQVRPLAQAGPDRRPSGTTWATSTRSAATSAACCRRELWGKDEDYLWYSTGGAAYFTDLAEGILGEGTLQARYIRGAFDDKPFTLGKYESTRIRVAIAELAANGGAPMGFYTRFTDPAARKEIVRYYSSSSSTTPLYRGNRPHAEVLLLYPAQPGPRGRRGGGRGVQEARQEAARPPRPVRRPARTTSSPPRSWRVTTASSGFPTRSRPSRIRS